MNPCSASFHFISLLILQRPIVLKGHERSICHIKYNHEGDLLFSCSKAHTTCLWRTKTGERIGTYDGHTGSVWYLDVNEASSQLLTASGDGTCKLWNVESGKELYTFTTTRLPFRCVGFAEGDSHFLSVTDQVMGGKATVNLYRLAEDLSKQDKLPMRQIVGDIRINQAHWGAFNERIFTADQDGAVRVYDTETGRRVGEITDHKQACMSIQFDKEKFTFITASKDGTARLYDATSLELLKVYDIGRPLNSAAISPLKPHIILGGGQSAETVTTTRVDPAQFRVRFFHKIFQEEICSVQGHFGPVNVLAFAPDGLSFASGAEDGFVRLHHLDDVYVNDRI